MFKTCIYLFLRKFTDDVRSFLAKKIYLQLQIAQIDSTRQLLYSQLSVTSSYLLTINVVM